MNATITNKKRSCTAEGVSGTIKLQGQLNIDSTTPKVLSYNLSAYVNTSLTPDEESYVFAGSINKDGAFNLNIQPDFSDAVQTITAAALELVASVEAQYAK